MIEVNKYFMTSRLRCTTLFNITQTNVLNRTKPVDVYYDIWVQQRNTQCNFDTIVQIISLRSLPENITKPQYVINSKSLLTNFGSNYQKIKDFRVYYFDFDVNYVGVFTGEDGEKLSSLYNDCHGVPMTVCNNQTVISSLMLDTSNDLKNIHFEVLSHHDD